jgi:hypothetical protein
MSATRLTYRLLVECPQGHRAETISDSPLNEFVNGPNLEPEMNASCPQCDDRPMILVSMERWSE